MEPSAACVSEVSACSISVVVAVNDCAAVGYVGVVVEDYSVAVPVWLPMMPTPGEPAEETDSKARAERYPW